MTHVVVISPHLDDGIMSVGGTIRLLKMLGVCTKVVTLFAGDPSWVGPPSIWDAKRGTDTAAEAFAFRRAEDRAACASIGAKPVWLPFLDGSYVSQHDPDEVWRSLQPHLVGTTAVMVPGVPLCHPDHLFATELLISRLDASIPLLFYAEYPYALRPRYLPGFIRGRVPIDLTRLLGEPLVRRSVLLDARGRAAKRRAVACYQGELKRLGGRRLLDSALQRVLHEEKLSYQTDQQPTFFQPGEP